MRKNTDFTSRFYVFNYFFLFVRIDFLGGIRKTEGLTDFDEISLVINLNFFITLNNQFNFLPRGSF